MTERPVLVVGAGLAGLNAACALAEAGEAVLVIDQAPTIGGAVMRQPLPGVVGRPFGQAHGRLWARLMQRLAPHRDRIEIRCQTRFVGLDRTGTALITSRDGRGRLLRPRALVIATGATETVRPRPGWTLDGVSTVGALQVGLKMTGAAPPGRVILAGNGPLLFAAGAQLAQAGKPPVAILEEGRPFSRPWEATRLPAAYLREALGYLSRLVHARVPVLTGAVVRDIRRDKAGLCVLYERRGKLAELAADRVGLHDGLARNDLGLAFPNDLPTRLAGDCNTGLGARAAAIDGENAGREIAACLAGAPRPNIPAGVERERRAQARLARLFGSDRATPLMTIPDDTLICRCEGKTAGDLRRISRTRIGEAGETVRTIRLTGRFGMGRCQGRFCLRWTSDLLGGRPSPRDLRGSRWPVQPISIRALLDAEDHTNHERTPQ